MDVNVPLKRKIGCYNDLSSQLKTTNENKYWSSRNAGVLPPNASQCITVYMQGPIEVPHDIACSDLFFIQFGYLSSSNEPDHVITTDSIANELVRTGAEIITLRVFYVTGYSDFQNERTHLLTVYPQEIALPLEYNSENSCAMDVLNETDKQLVFKVYDPQASLMNVRIEPSYGVIVSQSRLRFKGIVACVMDVLNETDKQLVFKVFDPQTSLMNVRIEPSYGVIVSQSRLRFKVSVKGQLLPPFMPYEETWTLECAESSTTAKEIISQSEMINLKLRFFRTELVSQKQNMEEYDRDKAVVRERELHAAIKMVARALTLKGTALAKMAKDYEPAIEAFQKALTEHWNPDTLKKLGDAVRAKKDLEQQEYFDPKGPVPSPAFLVSCFRLALFHDYSSCLL